MRTPDRIERNIERRVTTGAWRAIMELEDAAGKARTVAGVRDPVVRGHLRGRYTIMAWMLDGRARWLRTLAAAAVACILAACGEPEEGNVEIDGGPDDAACTDPVGQVQRDAECKAICLEPALRCAGSTGAECYDECLRFGTGGAYCPPQ